MQEDKSITLTHVQNTPSDSDGHSGSRVMSDWQMETKLDGEIKLL